MLALLRRRITFVWLLLFLAIALSWQFGHGFGFGERYTYATVAIVTIAFIKSRLRPRRKVLGANLLRVMEEVEWASRSMNAEG